MKGNEGRRGLTGFTGAMGPAGKVQSFDTLAKQLHYVDRSIENIYTEMGAHIARMTTLQRELDVLRESVKKLVAVAVK